MPQAIAKVIFETFGDGLSNGLGPLWGQHELPVPSVGDEAHLDDDRGNGTSSEEKEIIRDHVGLGPARNQGA